MKSTSFNPLLDVLGIAVSAIAVQMISLQSWAAIARNPSEILGNPHVSGFFLIGEAIAAGVSLWMLLRYFLSATETIRQMLRPTYGRVIAALAFGAVFPLGFIGWFPVTPVGVIYFAGFKGALNLLAIPFLAGLSLMPYAFLSIIKSRHRSNTRAAALSVFVLIIGIYAFVGLLTGAGRPLHL